MQTGLKPEFHIREVFTSRVARPVSYAALLALSWVSSTWFLGGMVSSVIFVSFRSSWDSQRAVDSLTMLIAGTFWACFLRMFQGHQGHLFQCFNVCQAKIQAVDSWCSPCRHLRSSQERSDSSLERASIHKPATILNPTWLFYEIHDVKYTFTTVDPMRPLTPGFQSCVGTASRLCHF